MHGGGDETYTSDGLTGRRGDEESSQLNSPSDLRCSGRMFIPSPGSAAAGATLEVSPLREPHTPAQARTGA